MKNLKKKNLAGSILLPARCNSEWDQCDAYLIGYDKEMLQDLLAKMDEAAYLAAKSTTEGGHNSGFMHLAYFGSCGIFCLINNFSDFKEENPVVITCCR